MKIRTDFHSVNLSKGTKTRSIVGGGERRDEVDELISEEQYEEWLAIRKEIDQFEKDVVARIRAGYYTPEKVEELERELARMERPQ